MVTLHNNIEDYTLQERFDLEEAFKNLEVKAQSGLLTTDETRIRVAYVRLKREENFKISQTPVKKVKEPKDPNAPKAIRSPRKKVEKIIEPSKQERLAKASRILQMQLSGQTLSEEDSKYLEEHLTLPPPA